MTNILRAIIKEQFINSKLEHIWIHYVGLTVVPGGAVAEMRRQMSETVHFYRI